MKGKIEIQFETKDLDAVHDAISALESIMPYIFTEVIVISVIDGEPQ